jgi:hypothetical protein
MPYRVQFNWSGPSLDEKHPVALSCEGQNIALEKTRLSGLANAVIQISTDETQRACVSVNNTQTFQLRPGRFLYMDVGLWLEGKQTFGLVCGHEAALCNYIEPQFQLSGSVVSEGPLYEPLLNAFVKAVRTAYIIDRQPIPDPDPHPGDPNHLYVILPDMHVAAAPPLDVEVPPLESDMVKRDLFNSRESIPAMVSFLSSLQLFAEVNKGTYRVTLVQVGDMYELWADRPCYFKGTDENDPHVELTPLNGTNLTAQEVGQWVGATHLLYPDLFAAFDKCQAAGVELRFLQGNHDCYMALEDVVRQANNYITKSVEDGRADGIPPRWIETLRETTVYTRTVQKIDDKIEDHIFIEHGQRVDAYNRDGQQDGWAKTQPAVDWRTLKAFDTSRRPTFVMGAAAYWTMKNEEFGIYVGGHTHDPVLNIVEVVHMRQDQRNIPTKGGPKVVWVDTGLVSK